MPNGGIDNCAYCGFNKAVQVMGVPTHPLGEEFKSLSYCTLRDVKVANLLWTYCKNFRHGKHLPEPDKRVDIKGPILAGGLFERNSYVRIPWHDKIQPMLRQRTPRICMVCGRTTDEGITVIHKNKEISFCTNRHYIDWWKTVHDDPDIVSDGLATPEEYYQRRKLTMEYGKRIKKHLSHYKNTVLKITENGKWRGKEYGHILPIDEKEKDRKNRITLNILAPYRQDFFDGTLSEINYHINFHHLNSSQAMCINFFYPLYEEKKLDLVLAVLEIKKEQIAYKKVCFEKISDIDGTNFDFYFETHSGLKFYFEIKYTENKFGGVKCDSDDEHERKYKKVYQFKLQNIKDEYKRMGPFFANYQIMRNLIHIKEDSHVVFIYPQENIEIREGAEKAAEILKESAKSHFHCLTWEDLLTHIEEHEKLPEKLQNHMKDFKVKYLPKD